MRLLALITCLSATLTTLLAQPSPEMARFNHYTSTDGLSQQVVRATAQDSDGFIWFGTEDGLNKFDGYNFKVYRNEKGNNKSLPDNFIYTLCPSKDGDMWIGTNNGGVAKYHKETDNFTSYQYSEESINSLSANRIESLIEDNNGNLWIGTYGGGLNKLEIKTNTIHRISLPTNDANSSSTESVVDMVIDKNNFLWIRTYTALLKFNTNTNSFSQFRIDYVQRTADLSGSMYIDNDDILWSTMGGSVLKLNTINSSYNIIEFSNYFDHGVWLADIEPMNDNFLWISDYNGIFLFNKKDYSVTAYKNDQTNPNSLLSGGCISLLSDSFGSLWVGTNSKGISKLNLNLKDFNHYSKVHNNPYSISGKVIRALMCDSKENVWVSVDSRINKLQKNKEGKYIKDTNAIYSELDGITATSFLEDNSGNLWIGTWGFGIRVLIDGDTKKLNSVLTDAVNQAVRDSTIQALYQDASGNIWVGTESGLDLFNPETFEARYFNSNPEDKNSMAPLGVQANCITEDIYGNMWVGTWGGVTRITPNDASSNSFNTDYSFTQFRTDSETKQTISDNRTISMLYDPKIDPNTIYTGTYGSGLNKITFSSVDKDNVEIKHYTKQDGLPNGVVYTIQSDLNKNIWLSTNLGLIKLITASDSMVTYDVNDGLQDNQFYWGAATKTKDGELIFGGINGINSFYPQNIRNDINAPVVVITDLKLFNNSVQIGKEYNNQILLNKHINQVSVLELNHKNNVFTIDFSGLQYAFPKNNNYRYKLHGFDEEWVYADSDKRSLTYTNLDAGKYTLEIYASNYDGVWSQTPKTMEIIISPPFWETLLFRLFIISAILFTVYFIYKSRMKMIKHDKLVLESQIKDAKDALSSKMEELDIQKQELLQKVEFEEKTKWQQAGLSMVSELIRKHQGNINNLTQLLLSKVTDYINVTQGAMYILNDTDKENQFLEQIARRAISGEATYNERISIGEGLVGSCFKSQERIKVDNIPVEYMYIESGLGKTTPLDLYLFPINYNNSSIGVLEISSYSEIDEHVIEFIEKFVEITASAIVSESSNRKLHYVLDDYSQLTEKLMAQEEEMRQNIEELKATQEQSERKEKELLGIIESYR